MYLHRYQTRSWASGSSWFDEVLVDIGYKSEGRIPLNEMGLKPNQQPADVFAEI